MKMRYVLLLSAGGLPWSCPAYAQAGVLNASLPSIRVIDADFVLSQLNERTINATSSAEISQVGGFVTSAATPAEVQVDGSAVKLNPTGRDVKISAPMRDGDFILSEVKFILAADDRIRIEVSSFTVAMRPILSAEKFEALQVNLAALEFASAEKIAELGYLVRYDPANIALTVQLPADFRTARDILLGRFEDPGTGMFYEPATLSGYINFRAFADYIWSGGPSGFGDPSSLIDSAIRYKGIVLENEASLRLGSPTTKTFTREATRLVYDDRRRLIRYAAGDLDVNGRGFSGTPQLAGFSAERIYSVVDPLRSVQPRGDRSFTLKRPATVEAMINGRPVRRIRLDPGVYNVRDFPFVQGTNDVQFSIQDDAGGIETIQFSQFFDRTLLATGLTEFALQAGILAPFAGGSRDYRFSEPAASGWVRRGINETLTLGGNFNVRKDGITVGGEVALASAIGIIGTDFAVSKVEGVGTGFAANASIQRSFRAIEGIARSASFSAEYRSKNFANPGFAGVDNRIAWSLSATYSQPIAQSQFVSLNVSYSIARGGFDNQQGARLTYGYNISPALNLTVDAVYEDRPIFGRDYGVRATLLVRLGRRSTGVAEVDSRTERARLSYQTSRGEGVGAWAASADVDFGKDDVGFNGGFNYTANRVEAGLAHSTTYDFTGQFADSQRTSIRAGTAIVFADGKFGLSRPVYDGFAMVAPHKSLKGAQVVIDPRENYYTAKSGTFGPAIEPNLGAYIRRTVTYDVPNAPLGYDLGAGSAKVVPPYRGGYLITAGSDYSVTALGTLIASNGEPISLLAGKATEVGVTDPKTLTIFTNRTGRFGISGMRAGKWRIEMPTEPPTVVEVEIPDEALGVVRLGEVKLGDPE